MQQPPTQNRGNRTVEKRTSALSHCGALVLKAAGIVPTSTLCGRFLAGQSRDDLGTSTQDWDGAEAGRPRTERPEPEPDTRAAQVSDARTPRGWGPRLYAQ